MGLKERRQKWMNDNRDNHKNKIRLFHDQNVAREHHWQKRVGKDRLKGYGMNKRLSVRQIPREHSHVSLATWQWSSINVPRLSTHEVWSLHEAPVVLTKRILEVLSSGNPLIAWYYSTNNTSNQFLSHLKPFLTSYLSHCTPVVHFN